MHLQKNPEIKRLKPCVDLKSHCLTSLLLINYAYFNSLLNGSIIAFRVMFRLYCIGNIFPFFLCRVCKVHNHFVSEFFVDLFK